MSTDLLQKLVLHGGTLFQEVQEGRLDMDMRLISTSDMRSKRRGQGARGEEVLYIEGQDLNGVLNP